MRVRLLSLRCRAVKCVSDQSDVLKLRTLPKKQNQAPPQSALLPPTTTNKPCGTWEYPPTSAQHAEDMCMHLIHKQLLNNFPTPPVKRAETEIEVWDIDALLRPHIQSQFVFYMKAWRQSGELINTSQRRKTVLTAGSPTWEWPMQPLGCEALRFKNPAKPKFNPKPTHPRSLIQPSETSSRWLPLLLTWWCKFGEDREDHIFPLASLLVWKTMTAVTACHLATFCHFQHFHTPQGGLVFTHNKYYVDASQMPRALSSAGAQTYAEYGLVMEKGIFPTKVGFLQCTLVPLRCRTSGFLVHSPDQSMTFIITELLAVCRTRRQGDGISLSTLLPCLTFTGNNFFFRAIICNMQSPPFPSSYRKLEV